MVRLVLTGLLHHRIGVLIVLLLVDGNRVEIADIVADELHEADDLLGPWLQEDNFLILIRMLKLDLPAILLLDQHSNLHPGWLLAFEGKDTSEAIPDKLTKDSLSIHQFF